MAGRAVHEGRRGTGRPEGPGGGPVVVFSGGGTGGHLYPALALADALRARRPGIRPYFVGARGGVEARVLPQRGEEHALVAVEGLQRRRPGQNLRALVRLGGALLAVARLFRSLRPELVVVTGGYAGGPAGLVARMRGVPLALQEQNSVPGVTTRLLSRWARQIHLAYPEARDRLPRRVWGRCLVSGNPIRPPVALSRAEARRRLAVPEQGPLVLVVGGSQGSRALNLVVGDAVESVVAGSLARPDDLTVLWGTGPRHLEAVQARLDELGAPGWVRALGYIEDMPAALAGADLAVSRAGAMATSEFLGVGLPSLLVPLPTAAADHQTGNARALEEAGAALCLPEADLTGPELWRQVLGVVTDEPRRAAMAAAARARGRPLAAAEIAAALDQLLPGAGQDGRGASP